LLSKYFAKRSFLLAAIFLAACAPLKEEKIAAVEDTHWTLQFTWLKNNKPTHTETYQFISRMDCFNQMYEMQKVANKTKNQVGSGLCFKAFAEGQERTSNDQLAKYSK
jgi:hypothetical protein